MKIAVTSKGKELDSPVDPRFGRAAYILIVDTQSLEFDVMDNSENINAFKGAGIQTAVMIAKKGVTTLLTGFCGPNAFKTLNKGGIKVGNDLKGTVREAVTALNKGQVTFADSANADAHW